MIKIQKFNERFSKKENYISYSIEIPENNALIMATYPDIILEEGICDLPTIGEVRLVDFSNLENQKIFCTLLKLLIKDGVPFVDWVIFEDDEDDHHKELAKKLVAETEDDQIIIEFDEPTKNFIECFTCDVEYEIEDLTAGSVA